MDKITLFSADIGNGFVKCKSSLAGSASFPAAISATSGMLDGFNMFGMGKPNNDFVIGYNGKEYAIGDTVRLKGLTPVTIQHRSRIATDYYRVLFAAALASTIWESATVRAVVSLPPAAYWDKDKLKAILAGEYIVDLPGLGEVVYSVPADSLSVIPEGVGAACCMALDERGNDRPGEYLSSSTVGIVDIGTYTTDFILLDQLRIVRSGCDSLTHALHDIYSKLRQFCNANGYSLDHYLADRIMRQRYFMAGGIRHDLNGQIDQWVGELVPALSGTIRSLWNGGDDCDHMILAGGGSDLIYTQLAMEYPQLRTITGIDAYMANCEGAYRWLCLKTRAGQ